MVASNLLSIAPSLMGEPAAGGSCVSEPLAHWAPVDHSVIMIMLFSQVLKDPPNIIPVLHSSSFYFFQQDSLCLIMDQSYLSPPVF